MSMIPFLLRIRWHFLALVLGWPVVSMGAAPNALTVEVGSGNALPVVRLGGTAVLRTSYVFWGEKWTVWAGQSLQKSTEEPLHHRYTGINKVLKLTMEGDVRPLSSKALRWKWNYVAEDNLDPVVGGGLSFQFDLGTAQRHLGEPELLADGAGWRWGRGGAQVEMRFDPAPASVYFERGKPHEIRVMFYKDKVKAGPLSLQAQLTVGGGGEIAPSARERAGLSRENWQPVRNLYEQDWPIDLRFMNAHDRPAGQRGHISAKGEQFVYPDGRPIRFWGTNLTAGALFKTPRHVVKAEAKRLAAMGYNLVRIHHHDSLWVKPNIFGPSGYGHGGISEQQAEKIDWWIKCLKDEGIYIWLDLHVGRVLTAADGIDIFEEIAKGKSDLLIQGINYFSPSIQAAMRKFSVEYLTRRNTETGLRAIDDPAVAFVQITNENDVTSHYGGRFLPAFVSPAQNARYMAEVNRFAKTHGLPADQAWRAWEHGPAKIFLNDMEQRFHVSEIQHLRALGLKALVSTTSTWGQNPLSALPALTAGDHVDIHAYDDEGWLERNPAFGANFMHWMHAGQVAGRPATVSEWNTDAVEALDRHTWPVYVGASAAHQGISALMHFDDAMSPFELRGRASKYEAFHDPSMALTLPLGALIYRTGMVGTATKRLVWAPDTQALFYKAASPTTMPALRTAGEKGALRIAMPKVKELPWLSPSPSSAADSRLGSLESGLIGERDADVVSDTGQLRRNWTHGVAQVVAPAAQVLLGWTHSASSWTTPDVQAQLDIPLAALSVASLDGTPIPTAKSLIVTIVGRAESSGGQLPWVSEPVGGIIRIRSAQDKKVQAARTDGTRHQFVAKAVQGWITLDLRSVPGMGGLALNLSSEMPSRPSGPDSSSETRQR